MIEGQGDVEVLAYVNSNLILIHNDPKSAEKIPVSAPNSVSEMAPKTLLPKNLNINKSVTVINEAVISKSKVKSDSKSESKSNAKKVVKKVDDPIVANFSVEGWPVNKSRMATDYIDYQGQTAIISPKNTFASPFASDVSEPQVLIAVQSGPKNAKLRREVRSTWGSSCVTTHSSWCSLIFVLGTFNSSGELEEEQETYGDILQESFVDSYNNLTLKSIEILKYFVESSDTLGNKFLLKTDDDSYVHLESLWDLAKSRLVKKSNNLMGYLQLGLKRHHYLPLAHKPTKSNVKKTAWSKWLIPTYMYNKRFFPQFLSGSGYLVTRAAAECLLLKSKTIPIVHLEDVYITGLCASSCHLRREHDKGFKARPMDKISEYQIQASDIVLHYTSGHMDRFHKQVLQLKQADSILDPSEP